MYRNFEDLIESLNTDYFQLHHVSHSLKRLTQERKETAEQETNLKLRIKEKEQQVLIYLQKKYENNI
jgi:hypothetical protein